MWRVEAASQLRLWVSPVRARGQRSGEVCQLPPPSCHGAGTLAFGMIRWPLSVTQVRAQPGLTLSLEECSVWSPVYEGNYFIRHSLATDDKVGESQLLPKWVTSSNPTGSKRRLNDPTALHPPPVHEGGRKLK